MVVKIGSPAELAAAFAERFESLAKAAIAERGRFAVAIPGGSVADAFLPGLAGIGLDWPAVHVFWADERAVPQDSPESNVGQARRQWLDAPRVTPAVYPPWPGEGSLDAAAGRYEATLLHVLGDPLILDLLLLGVGPDGHVASLFPGHPGAAERHRRVIGVDDAPKPPPRRLTMTLPVLAAARTVIVAAFGGEKAAVIADAMHNPAAASPLAHLMRSAPHLEMWMDSAAAAQAGAAR